MLPVDQSDAVLRAELRDALRSMRGFASVPYGSGGERDQRVRDIWRRGDASGSGGDIYSQGSGFAPSQNRGALGDSEGA